MGAVNLSFAAVERRIVESIPELKEVEARGKGYIQYGGDNLYPEYLYSLYNDVTTLKTIIEGTSDFVTGDDIKCNVLGFQKEVNRKGHTIRDLIKWCSRDWLIYGGFAIQVIRNKMGQLSELYYIDFRNIRSDKYNEGFYYSENFNKKYTHTDKVLLYPKYVPENTSISTSILYVKNNISTTYPIPRYSGALRDCEIERNIDELHLAGLENGFMGSYMISLLNGVPTDEEKAQLEKEIQSKFCGSGNAGRIVLNFANGKDNAAQLDKLDVEDFSEKYQAAAQRARQQIFCAFGAVPQIFGLTSESTGFSLQEFQEAFKLYNRVTVKSIQRMLSNVFDGLFGVEKSITITPFSLEDEDENNGTEIVQ